LQAILPIKITRVESLRDGITQSVGEHQVHRWLEHVESESAADLSLDNGMGLLYRAGQTCYLAGWPDATLLRKLVEQ
jgi:beta-galactosidase